MIKKISILLSLVLLAVPIMATACNDNSTDNSAVTLTVTPVPQVEGAAFTGNYSFYGIDSDGDGIYNSLAIDAEVNVSIAGDYFVTGSLKSDNTTITDMSSYRLTMPLSFFLSVSEPGLETITLTFSGEYIYCRGIDGIYTAVLVIGRNGSVADYQSFDGPFYNHNEFGEIPAGMEVIADYGEDIDGNGLFDYLTAEVDVTVRRATDCILAGILYCKEGEITSVTNTYYLEESVVLKLNFDGTKLRLSEIDGPYLLDVNLYCEYYNQIGSQEYFTSTYMHTDFQEPAHRFTGTYSDYGTDTDGDGLYNYLTIEVGIEITAPGDYTVEGYLYDSSEELIDIAYTSDYLDVGNQSVILDFNGVSINRNQVDGPYYLKYLTLRDSDSDQDDLINFVLDACTTFAYSFADFQLPPKPWSALTDNYRDHGTDTDGDGIFDYLTVDVEVVLVEPGQCVIWAQLADSNGEEIVWAENSAELGAEQPQIIQLNFSGEAIYNHGVDGPYYLRDVYIYHTGEPTLPDYVSEAYTTSTYEFTEFQKPDMP